MFYKYSLHTKFIIVSLLLLLDISQVKCQVNENLERIKIEFSSTDLSLKQALDELNALPDINIVSNNTKVFRKIYLKIPSNPTTVKDALEEILTQTPVNINYSNNQIIVKIRELANKYTFSGSIKDADTHENLVGVNIYLKNTYKGTVTDLNGKFTFKFNPGQYTIVYKYIGYKEKEMTINLFKDLDIAIKLEAALLEIEEVSIVG